MCARYSPSYLPQWGSSPLGEWGSNFYLDLYVRFGNFAHVNYFAQIVKRLWWNNLEKLFLAK
jgi:hypothetical protein